MNITPKAEESARRPFRSSSDQNDHNSKFKDFVLPSSFKFPESKRRSLREVINIKAKTSPFKKSNSIPAILKHSRRRMQSTHENKSKSYGSTSPDLNCSIENVAQSSTLRDLNNSPLYINKTSKSPDLDFTNDTVSPPVKKCAINMINEVTQLLSPPSTKSCTINLSPDMVCDVRKYKDYSKMDIFENSVIVNSQSSLNSEPRIGKLIITNDVTSPDMYLTKHIKPKSGDLFLTEGSNANDSPDLFSMTQDITARKSPDLFLQSQSSQNSCVQSSQLTEDYASPDPISSLVSSFKRESSLRHSASTTPQKGRSWLSHDSLLALSPDLSMIKSSQYGPMIPPAMIHKLSDSDLDRECNLKRMIQDPVTPPNKKPRMNQTLVSPVEGLDFSKAFDLLKYLESSEFEHPRRLSLNLCDPLLASANIGKRASTKEKHKQSPSHCGIKDPLIVDAKRNAISVAKANMRDIAVDDYYAQTISSQYMSSMSNVDDSDLFHVPCSWKDESMKDTSILSQSILQPNDASLKKDMSQSILQPKDITMRTIPHNDESQCNGNPMSIPQCPDILRDCQYFKPNGSSKINNISSLDVNDIEEDLDGTLLDMDDRKDFNTLVNDTIDANETVGAGSSEEFQFLNEAQVTSNDTSVSNEALKEARKLVACKLSDSSNEEKDTTPLVKSFKEMIEYLKKSIEDNKTNNFRPPKSDVTDGSSKIPGLLLTESKDDFRRDIDVYSQDLHIIETSPSRKVQLWLEKHLDPSPEDVTPRPELQQLNIEDFDSEDHENDAMNCMIEEVPEIEAPQIESTAEPVEKQLVIEDNNTEKSLTQKTIGKCNFEEFIDLKSQELIDNINSEIHENVTETEEVNLPERMIEEINTEKCEDIVYYETDERFEIECPGSLNSTGESREVFDAAQILLSFKCSPTDEVPVVPEKTIKFKPGSLGARLRSELAKLKSAREIWNYEVTKATESQDKASLADLYKGQLNLTMVSCWSESSHVVVKAIKTDVTAGSANNSVLLLLQSSDFPKHFKQRADQQFSIFPPWISHWIPELEMNFLTNVERIRFSDSRERVQTCELAHSRDRVRVSELAIDPLDDDFYMKLIGLGGGLVSKNS